mmetsp:Transcript_23170/g.32073  ORF Transcript_23170/g.32073 Transcript_23170/m.32073 type:complete len:248 (-) Transcript_23170:102-845(-)
MLITLCLGGDLLKAQEQFPDNIMDEASAKFYAACVVSALEYLHAQDIAYRDIKQENLLLDSQGYIKVVDFGLSKVLRGDQKTYTMCGTAQFLAPEIVARRGHRKEVDFWALGILIHEMITGDSPFVSAQHGYDPDVIFHSIMRGFFVVPDEVSPEAADLITSLLQKEPQSRLGAGKDGFRALKSHPWFREIDWPMLLRRQVEAPYVPVINDALDSSNFDAVEHSDDEEYEELTAEDLESIALLDEVF